MVLGLGSVDPNDIGHDCLVKVQGHAGLGYACWLHFGASFVSSAHHVFGSTRDIIPGTSKSQMSDQLTVRRMPKVFDEFASTLRLQLA